MLHTPFQTPLGLLNNLKLIAHLKTYNLQENDKGYSKLLWFAAYVPTINIFHCPFGFFRRYLSIPAVLETCMTYMKYIVGKPTLALLKCIIWWKIIFTRMKDYWAKISQPFCLKKLQLPRDQANMCEVNRPESVQLFQLKFPNPRNISPPIDGSKGTKFKCCLTVQTPIAMQVNFCLTLVRFSYLSYVESVQTSERCSFSQREASH